MNLKKKKILVAITGGIAVYKVCDLVRDLIKSDAEVRVMMSESATKFVTPLTFETLTNHEVAHRMFNPTAFTSTHHIDWADWADCMVFAPATANVIGKLANGLSDDIVTTVACAFIGPKIIAPAMNSNMWKNPMVQENLRKLEKHKYLVMPTEIGDLACGWTGEGRLAPTAHIKQYIYKAFSKQTLKSKHVLVSSGPTIEDIDPVRFISNRSSGKMGHALAYAAWCKGADVTLVHGQSTAHIPFEITSIASRSADDMSKAISKAFKETDIYISAAAIADYKTASYSDKKIKKTNKSMSLDLEKTNDILKSVAKNRNGKRLIGFALETDNELANAKKKLKEKNLEYIVLNNPKNNGAGFETDTNLVSIIDKSGKKIDLPLMDKQELAFEILDKVLN